AGHYRWYFFKNIVGRAAILFYDAWWRRCHYTADRIGFLVAGDFEASRYALISITVGKKLSAATRIGPIREQDNELRSRTFARFCRLFREYPYMVQRIIELESFRAYV